VLTDLVLDPATGVSIDPASARNLRYLDGTGPYLDGLFRGTDDLGSGSEVLLGQASSWPLIYHVSPHRWSLLDCIGLPGRACTVLELGAGCGSVARWLGERFSDVRAIQGSPARAALTRGHCRGLDSVHVYEANFSCLEIDDEFDVVTMRGVLEYSTVYHPAGASISAENAALANLRTGARALRSPGVMVVAIENRLGAKSARAPWSPCPSSRTSS